MLYPSNFIGKTNLEMTDRLLEKGIASLNISGKNYTPQNVARILTTHVENMRTNQSHETIMTGSGLYQRATRPKDKIIDYDLLSRTLKALEEKADYNTIKDFINESTQSKFYLAFTSYYGNAIVEGLTEIIAPVESTQMNSYQMMKAQFATMSRDDLADSLSRRVDAFWELHLNTSIFAELRYTPNLTFVGDHNRLPNRLCNFYFPNTTDYDDRSNWTNDIERTRLELINLFPGVASQLGIIEESELGEDDLDYALSSLLQQLYKDIQVSAYVHPVTMANNVLYSTSSGSHNFSGLLTPLAFETEVMAEIQAIVSTHVLDNGYEPTMRLDKILKVAIKVHDLINESANRTNVIWCGSLIPFRFLYMGAVHTYKHEDTLEFSFRPGEDSLFSDYITKTVFLEGKQKFSPLSMQLLDRSDPSGREGLEILKVNYKAQGNVANQGKESKAITAGPELLLCKVVYRDLSLKIDAALSELYQGKDVPSLTLESFEFFLNFSWEMITKHIDSYDFFYNHWKYTVMKGKYEVREAEKPARLFFMEGMLYLFYGLFNHYQNYYDYESAGALPPFRDKDYIYDTFFKYALNDKEDQIYHYSDNIYVFSNGFYASLDVSSMEANHTPTSSFMTTFEIIRNCVVPEEQYVMATQAFIHEYLYGVKFHLTGIGSSNDKDPAKSTRTFAAVPSSMMPSGTCGTYVKNDTLSGFLCELAKQKLKGVKLLNQEGSISSEFQQLIYDMGMVVKTEKVIAVDSFINLKNLEFLEADLLGSSIMKVADSYVPVLERKRALKALVFNKTRTDPKKNTYVNSLFHDYVTLAILKSMSDKNVLLYGDLIPIFFNLHHMARSRIELTLAGLADKDESYMSLQSLERELGETGLSLASLLGAIQYPINKTPITIIMAAEGINNGDLTEMYQRIFGYLDAVGTSEKNMTLQAWLNTMCYNSYNKVLLDTGIAIERTKNTNLLASLRNGLPFYFYTSKENLFRTAAQEMNDFFDKRLKDRKINSLGLYTMVIGFMRNHSTYFYSSKTIKDFHKYVLRDINDFFYRVNGYKLTRYDPVDLKANGNGVNIKAPKIFNDSISKERIKIFALQFAEAIDAVSHSKLPLGLKIRVDGTEVTRLSPAHHKILALIINRIRNPKDLKRNVNNPAMELLSLRISDLNIFIKPYKPNYAKQISNLKDELTIDQVLTDIGCEDLKNLPHLQILNRIIERYAQGNILSTRMQHYLHILFKVNGNFSTSLNALFRAIRGKYDYMKDNIILMYLYQLVSNSSESIFYDVNRFTGVMDEISLPTELSISDYRNVVPNFDGKGDRVAIRDLRLQAMQDLLVMFPGLLLIINPEKDLDVFDPVLLLGYTGNLDPSMLDSAFKMLATRYDKEMLLYVASYQDDLDALPDSSPEAIDVLKQTFKNMRQELAKDIKPAQANMKVEDIRDAIKVDKVIHVNRDNDVPSGSVALQSNARVRPNSSKMEELSYVPSQIEVATTNVPRKLRKRQMKTYKDTVKDTLAQELVEKVPNITNIVVPNLERARELTVDIKTLSEVSRTFKKRPMGKVLPVDQKIVNKVDEPTSSVISPALPKAVRLRPRPAAIIKDNQVKEEVSTHAIEKPTKKEDSVPHNSTNALDPAYEEQILDGDGTVMGGTTRITNNTVIQKASRSRSTNPKTGTVKEDSYQACGVCVYNAINPNSHGSKPECYDKKGKVEDKDVDRTRLVILDHYRFMVGKTSRLIYASIKMDNHCKPVHISIEGEDRTEEFVQYIKSQLTSESGKSSIFHTKYHLTHDEPTTGKVDIVLYSASLVADKEPTLSGNYIECFRKSHREVLESILDSGTMIQDNIYSLTYKEYWTLLVKLRDNRFTLVIPNANKCDKLVMKNLGVKSSTYTSNQCSNRGNPKDIQTYQVANPSLLYLGVNLVSTDEYNIKLRSGSEDDYRCNIQTLLRTFRPSNNSKDGMQDKKDIGILEVKDKDPIVLSPETSDVEPDYDNCSVFDDVKSIKQMLDFMTNNKNIEKASIEGKTFDVQIKRKPIGRQINTKLVATKFAAYKQQQDKSQDNSLLDWNI